MQVIVLHGTHGNSRENWFPWLKKELTERNILCEVPNLPSSNKPLLKKWLAELNKHNFLDSPVLIGHSLGGILALRALEQGSNATATLLVAPFIGKLGLDVDKANEDFIGTEFDWKTIKKNCGKFVVFYSNNDPYVPSKKSLEVAKKLGADKVIVKGAGHFNKTAGYLDFPLLLETILGIQNRKK